MGVSLVKFGIEFSNRVLEEDDDDDDDDVFE